MLRIEFKNPVISGGCAIPAPPMPSGLMDVGLHSDINGANITFSKDAENQTGVVVAQFAQDIEFFGEAFTYIEWLLINCNPNKTNTLQVDIYDDCCNQTIFEGIINKNDLEFCQIVDGVTNDCSIKVKLQNAAEQKTKYDCIREALVNNRFTDFAGTKFEYLPHYFYRYCKELRPRFFSDFFTGFYLFLSTIAFLISIPLFAIIGIISLICSVLGIDFDNDTPGQQSLWGEFTDAIGNGSFARYFIGCGKGHVVPRIRHLIQNACIQCNLDFESSIFNDASSIYYDAGYLYAKVELAGTEYLTGGGNVIQQVSDEYFQLNSPNMTGGEFLNKLVPTFNAFWDIIPNAVGGYKLVVEPLLPPSYTFIDFESSNYTINQLCYRTTDKRTAAILELKYSEDAADMIGNEADFYYDDIINWKSAIHSYNNADLEGLETVQSQFSRVRFRNDGITRDITSWWFEFGSTLDNAIYTPFIGTAIAFFKGIAQINPYSVSALESKNYLMLNTGTTFAPKILIPKTDDNRHFQTALRLDAGLSKNGVPYYYYNYPVWYCDREDLNSRGKPYFEPNLFFKFFASKNPNISGAKQGTEFELTLEYDCNLIRDIFQLSTSQGFRVKLRIPYLNTYVDTYEITSIQITQQTVNIIGTI